MKRSIWKYKILKDGCFHGIPKNSNFLAVSMQGRDICLWVEVAVEAPTEKRWFRVVGTGWDLPDDVIDYIGTVQQGDCVWHVYEYQPGGRL